jgi:hypothetical protein
MGPTTQVNTGIGVSMGHQGENSRGAPETRTESLLQLTTTLDVEILSLRHEFEIERDNK